MTSNLLELIVKYIIILFNIKHIRLLSFWSIDKEVVLLKFKEIKKVLRQLFGDTHKVCFDMHSE